MSNKKSLDVSKILQRFKETHNIKTDVELARLFGIKPNTIAMWKVRNYIDLNLIATHSEHSLDYIIKGSDFYDTKKSQTVNEPDHDYDSKNQLMNKIHALEIENAELKGQIKILKELLFDQRNKK